MICKLREYIRKSCKRVPPFPDRYHMGTGSSNQIYNQISLPQIGTIPDSFIPEGVEDHQAKRVSFCSFSKGSLTVEAAFALPIFFMVVICLVSIMNVYGMALEKAMQLRNTAEIAAAAADIGDDDLYIDMDIPFRFKPFYLPDGLFGFFVSGKAYVRAWNGRSDEKTAAGRSSTGSEYVYMTTNGEVYHTSAECSYLNPSIHSIPRGELAAARSSDGSVYRKCGCCKDNGAGVVYVTTYGDRYHSSPQCSGLKRTVKMVKKDDIEGYHVCSKCGNH